jgi:hypothetical protein
MVTGRIPRTSKTEAAVKCVEGEYVYPLDRWSINGHGVGLDWRSLDGGTGEVSD